MSNIKDVCCKRYSVNWSIASSMSSKLEPVIWLHDTGHIGIDGGADRWTDGRTYVHDQTKFSRIDGLPYFFNNGAQRASRSSAIIENKILKSQRFGYYHKPSSGVIKIYNKVTTVFKIA